MKAFLGMGLLGSNFVKAMIKKGDSVQVWNRTFERAKKLEKYIGELDEAERNAADGTLTAEEKVLVRILQST